jgi:DNA-binding Xre family transcriptional regulator
MAIMGITYKPLFHLLVERGLKKTDLIEKADISRMTLAKFAKNEPVSLEIIERLCKALDCQPSDIFEVVEDKPE